MTPMLTKSRNVTRCVLTPDSCAELEVAADGIYVPAEDRPGHDHGVADYQQGENDQHHGRSVVAGQQDGNEQDQTGREQKLEREPPQRLVLELVLVPDRR